MTTYTPAQEYVGMKFGRLTVLSIKPHNGRSVALCRCKCGRYTRAGMSNLLTDGTQSCGCLKQDRSRTTSNVLHAMRFGGERRARFISGLQRDVIEARIAGDMERAREAERTLESMGAEVPE